MRFRVTYLDPDPILRKKIGSGSDENPQKKRCWSDLHIPKKPNPGFNIPKMLKISTITTTNLYGRNTDRVS